MNNLRQPLLTLSVILVPLIFMAWFFWPTFTGLSELWLNPQKAYNHCYLLLICAVYFSVKRYRKSEPLDIQPSWWLLAPILIGLLFLALFQFTSIDILSHSLLPIIVVMFIGMVLGWPLLIKILPALGLLALCIPLWEVILPLLQSIAATLVETALAPSNIPAFIQETTITLPGGMLHIAESCGGLRYLLAAISLAYVVVLHLELKTLKSVLQVFLITIAVSILSNAFRIWLIVQIAFYSDMQHSLVHDHYSLGWIVFAVFLYPLMYIFMRVFGKQDDSEEANNKTIQNEPGLKNYLAAAIFATGVLIIHIFIALQSQKGEINTPLKIANYSEITANEAPWFPAYKNPDFLGLYKRQLGDSSVYIGVSSYLASSRENELISIENTLYKPEIEALNQQSQLQLAPGAINQYTIIKTDKSKIIANQWFLIGDKIFSSANKAKLYEIVNLLFGNARSTSIVVYINCKRKCEERKFQLNEQSELALGSPAQFK